MKKGDIVFHTGLNVRVRLIRLLKTRRPGCWTCEILDGPRAGSWYDADPVLLKAEA